MNMTCNIIEDLLPLYHDDACSEDSKRIVEEHLKNCNKCQDYLESMDNEVVTNCMKSNEEQQDIDILKAFKRKLMKRNIIISVVSVLCAVILFSGGIALTFNHQIPIFYEDGIFTVDQTDDGTIDILFTNGNDYDTSHAMVRVIKKDGIDKKIAYIYCADTIWTKYLSEPEHEGYGLSIGKDMVDDFDNSLEDVDAIYYLIGHYKELLSMSDEEFDKASKDAVLIWK